MIDLTAIGLWTKVVPYYDGFADLHALFQQQQKANPTELARQGESSDTTFVQFIQAWAWLQAEVGESVIQPPTLEERKKELKSFRARVVREKALAVPQDDIEAKVEIAMQSGNPKGELIKLILEGMPQEAPPKRMVREEWPGYRGCLAPFSVLDSESRNALGEIHAREGCVGVKALLAVPPADVAMWMVIEGGESAPIDMTMLLRSTQEMTRTQAEFKLANQHLTASNKKSRNDAFMEVKRLRNLLTSLAAQAGDSEQLIDAATSAGLSPLVGKKLTDSILNFSGNGGKLVVGVSCGLDYGTTEALHQRIGPAVRAAQRNACEFAVKAAVDSRLPIVLECHDAPPSAYSKPESDASTNETDEEESLKVESAVSDLVRILAKAAPETTTILLRTGSLTIAPELNELLKVWPNVFVGLSSSITYSKCPKEMLDITYDIPIERLIITSETPIALPAVFGGSHKEQMSVPPHSTCAVEHIAKIKGTLSRENVLQISTSNLCRAFRLTEPSQH
jgi:Tat protein secretion system quality control protein TatD with DNase activity